MDNAHSKGIRGSLLIVDDDPVVRQTLEVFLTREGYKSRSAPNGQMALISAVEDPPELILLDIRLPDMNGFQVCQRPKECSQTSHSPVIMLTGHGREEIVVEAMKAGVSDYLVKGGVTSESCVLDEIEPFYDLERIMGYMPLNIIVFEEQLTTWQKLTFALTVTLKSNTDFHTLP